MYGVQTSDFVRVGTILERLSMSSYEYLKTTKIWYSQQSYCLDFNFKVSNYIITLSHKRLINFIMEVIFSLL